ncbi:MAG: hypothetical protein MSB11_11855 [Prevotella sp.]|nr:hypothetical protein [Prevotella sp.]
MPERCSLPLAFFVGGESLVLWLGLPLMKVSSLLIGGGVYNSLVVGYWLLVIGCWLLVSGFLSVDNLYLLKNQSFFFINQEEMITFASKTN